MSPWILAARPKTLTASVVPVSIGSALAIHTHQFKPWIFFACLLGSLCIQIATNYINDASDFLRGADTADREGPQRMAQAGLISPKALFFASALLFILSALCGTYLIYQVGAAILWIGIASIIAAIAYTAGPFPLAYLGLGDLFVLIFFGFVAVLGTFYSHTQNLTMVSWISAFLVGIHGVALIAVNNTRDIAGDRLVGKLTLAARLGNKNSKIYYCCLYFVWLIGTIYLGLKVNYIFFLPICITPLALKNCFSIFSARDGKDFNLLLAATAKLQLIFGLLLCVSLIFY